MTKNLYIYYLMLIITKRMGLYELSFLEKWQIWAIAEIIKVIVTP
jgi:hypothetical protein